MLKYPQMPVSSLKGVKHVYFLGIAGQLMSALACVAKDFGFRISGSDDHAYSPATDYLKKHRIPYTEGHRPENVSRPDLIVLGNHIRPDNPELLHVLKHRLPLVSYPQMVRLLFPAAKYRLVVAGTHGKSTTTSLLGWILDQAGLNPTVLIGARSQNFRSSFRLGGKDLLVIEGDEYTSSCLDATPKFLYYRPTHAILTSIELDHVDIFDTWTKQADAFSKFAATVSRNLLLCGDTLNESALKLTTRARIEKYGLGNFDWQAVNITVKDGHTLFDVLHDSRFVGKFVSPLAGTHYVQDVLSAIALASSLGVSPASIAKSLATFKGVGQRFEIVSDRHGAIVISDYAHHPTAIKATLEATKARYPGQRLWAVYEPHTFTRIKGLLPQFAHSFDSAEQTVIADIFPARENALAGLVHAKDIVAAANSHPGIRYIATPDAVLEHLKTRLQKGDVVLIMAVGKFGELAQKLAGHLKSHPLK